MKTPCCTPILHFFVSVFCLICVCACNPVIRSSDPQDPENPSDPVTGWLYTEGNRIYASNGSVWHGRGVNIHDTRSNWECSYQEPNVDLVKAQIDAAVDIWGADFLRLCLETDNNSGPLQYLGVLDDTEYLDDIVEIIDYIGTKPGVYVLLSLWAEPTANSIGWPTQDTIPVWELLAERLKDSPQVMYGIINEPHGYNPAQDPELWTMFDTIVSAIRAVEDDFGTPYHLIAVQGTRDWSRILEYYIDNPIVAGGGRNIIYETHSYVPTADFERIVTTPAQTLPVIIGEYAPAYMSYDDCGNLLELAQELKIPVAAWSFHSTASPTLLEYYGKPDSCSPTGPLTPTPLWGNFVKTALASDHDSPVVQNVVMTPPCLVNDTTGQLAISAEVRDMEGNVASASADLSALGAGSNVTMTKSSGNTWEVTVTIPEEIDPGDKLIVIKAIDNEGNVKYRPNRYEVIEPATSDLVIYSGGTFRKTYTWGSLTEDTSYFHEGAESLKFVYNYAGWWADCGIGLSNTGLNVSGYETLEFWYRCSDSNQVTSLKLQISDASGNGSEYVKIGNANQVFEKVEIPLDSLQVNRNELSSFMFIMTDTQASSGTVWLDDIRFVP